MAVGCAEAMGTLGREASWVAAPQGRLGMAGAEVCGGGFLGRLKMVG